MLRKVSHWTFGVVWTVVVVGPVSPALGTVNLGPIYYGGHTYLRLSAGTWQAAEAEAVALGGHLATVNDATENAWILSTFGPGVWIGLNDIASEGTFVWVSGAPVGYVKWWPGQPDNYQDGDCVHLCYGGLCSGDYWNDLPCVGPLQAVVELDFILDDCNSNYIADSVDIAGTTSTDCNTNGTPDECDPDADSDGLPDECDGCPTDPAKSAPGLCGCGASDTGDEDGDGVTDCVDACPGMDDALDANSNGTPDCVEPTPQYIHFQGKLRDAAGVGINGTANFRVRLYDHPTQSNDVMSDEDFNDVVVRYGLFSLLVGSETPGGLPDSALDARPVYLGISVNGGPELTPRTQVAATALAFKSRNAERLVKPNTYDPAVTVFPNGFVGIGTSQPQYPLHMASGAHVTPGGVWTDASSRRLKDAITPLTVEEALGAFNELQPVTFRYKQSPREQHAGFIAEDVPDLVASMDRNGLSPMDIVAVLTKVLQVQRAEHERETAWLKAELARQQSEIEALRSSIDSDVSRGRNGHQDTSGAK